MCNAFGSKKKDGSGFSYHDFYASDEKANADDVNAARLTQARLWAERHNAQFDRRARQR